MENVADDVLHNILARLPIKPLLRYRCVSKNWNHIISYRCLIKSRPRQMILLPFTWPLVAIDANEPHHMVRLPHSPLDDEAKEWTQVFVVGTLNGIVLLALTNYKSLSCKLILYNPVTCASKIAVVMSLPLRSRPYVFGFGYGATKDDLKIVRFELCDQYRFDVFDLRTSSWSVKPRYIVRNFSFQDDAGMHVNGVLYWVTLRASYFGIFALNVRKMVFSDIKPPDGFGFDKRIEVPVLGSIGGCLCVANKVGSTRFDVWLMKEECSWMKTHSFNFDLERLDCFQAFIIPICISGNGKILIMIRCSSSTQLVIYDTSNDSYNTVNALPYDDDVNMNYKIVGFNYARSIEYT
ncbi:F-box protein CPR1-like [Bidens hawaiensis]|uniref:F-box protein CPR1-like n=1 Tax=Bidens hawaiensis TaxID=980011 RepID=UPI00404A45E5